MTSVLFAEMFIRMSRLLIIQLIFFKIKWTFPEMKSSTRRIVYILVL